MPRVTAPERGFTGEVAGQRFVDGVADVPADAAPAVAYFRRRGYSVTDIKPADVGPVEPDLGIDDEDVPFDPGAHSVNDVAAVLDGHSERGRLGASEARRILDAEAAGKARVGIISQREAILARERAADEADKENDQ